MGGLTVKNIILVVFATFLWALCFPLIEFSHRSIPPLLFAALRAFIAGTLLAIPIIIFRWRELIKFSLWRDSLLIGLSYTALGYGGMFLADGHVGPGVATVITNTRVIIAAILAYFILSERVSRNTVIGLTLGFLGIILIASSSFFNQSQNDVFGVGVLLLGAAGIAIGNILIKRLSPQHNVLVLTTSQFFVGAIALLLLSFVFEKPQPISWHPELSASVVLLSLGTAISESLWIYLLKQVDLTVLNTFTFLTPAFAVGMGVGFFQERLSLTDVLGMTTILLGLYFIFKSAANRQTYLNSSLRQDVSGVHK